MSRKVTVGVIIGVIILIAVGFGLYVSQLNVLPQSSYGLFDQLAAPTKTDRIMVVSPHQDDETLGAGGYVSQAIKAGAAVEIIYATDGNKHGLKTLRYAEAVKADGLLGVPSNDVKFFGYPDGDLSGQAAFEPRLKQEIDNFKPTIVFTTLPQDLHPDHAAAGRAVTAVAKAEPKTFQVDFFLIHYHRYPRPIGAASRTSYLLPPPSLISGNYNWVVYPLSPQTQSLKLQAIERYGSQLSFKNPVLRQLLLSFDQKNELFATLQQ